MVTFNNLKRQKKEIVKINKNKIKFSFQYLALETIMFTIYNIGSAK